MRALRLAIIATHPIQYHVPWFQGLAARTDLDLRVYFAMLPEPAQQGTGFGKAFSWDIPMLDGYSWSALENARPRPKLGSFFGSSTPDVRSALGRNRPDAVLINGWNALPLLQALRASKQLGVPRIVRGESNALRVRPLWKRPIHRLLLAQYDAFLSIGKANKAFYLANGVPEQRIFSAPYFVDNARFSAGARAAGRSQQRRHWKIPDDAVCFLFAGKLEPKKRILDLIGAMEFAVRGGMQVHLLVAGSGELMDEAQELAVRGRVPVTFAGFLNQTEMPCAYAAADCIVLPSGYGETWGLVVNEAMACGLPAIVSDRVGCGPDLVEHGVTGLVFPFGDVRGLGVMLRSLAEQPARRVEMGERAKERISRYSVSQAVAGTLEAVRHVTQGWS